MNQFPKYLFSIIIALNVSSCSIGKFYSSGDIAPRSQETALIQPMISITYKNVDYEVRKGVKDTLEDNLERLIKEQFVVSTIIPIDYRSPVSDEIISICSIKPQKVIAATVPKAIRQLVIDSGKRYGILIYMIGKLNKDSLMWGEEDLTTELHPYTLPYRISILVLDAIDNKVLYYAKDPIVTDLIRYDGTEMEGVKKQLRMRVQALCSHYK
ncbi:MAG: hypothetical protein IKR30_06965 [Bacteroidales bacterium]|nr:hypothetical protein [Bacteroidales bacterium]